MLTAYKDATRAALIQGNRARTCKVTTVCQVNQTCAALVNLKITYTGCARALKATKYQFCIVSGLIYSCRTTGTHVDGITQNHSAGTLVDSRTRLHIHIAIHLHRATCLAHHK